MDSLTNPDLLLQRLIGCFQEGPQTDFYHNSHSRPMSEWVEYQLTLTRPATISVTSFQTEQLDMDGAGVEPATSRIAVRLSIPLHRRSSVLTDSF